MVCRHVIVINYGYYCTTDLRSIWLTGCLQKWGCQPRRGSSCCLPRLVAKKRAAARAARAYPRRGQLARQRARGANQPAVPASPAARSMPELGCLQTLPAACLEGGRLERARGREQTVGERAAMTGCRAKLGIK